MDIEKALELHLKKYPALKAIHKENVCSGIAPECWKAPYQTFYIISNHPGNRRLGVPSPRIQINNYSLNYGQARQLYDLTVQALDGFTGLMGGDGGVKVEHGFDEDYNYNYQSETKLHNCMVDA